ncbi:hypothetical protein [Parabacteroides bouchesdurhonensis]|uniref:hypothetical protein n=1 Tax=Parabacteroides bouchesdurhonensis TaxID=1936995 RepID=UPI001F2996AE|nr:hypothetical protein [Parabacteroides bouchesdurhonensis]
MSRSLDFYLFSFLSCGMPFVDMAHLTRENIVGNGGFQAACACFGHQPGFGPYVGEDHAYLLDQSVLNKANNRITRSIAELVGKTG